MKREDVTNLISLAYSAFPLKPSVDAIDAWELALVRYEYGDVKVALGKLLGEPGRKYPPTPGEIAEVIEAPRREAKRVHAIDEQKKRLSEGEGEKDVELAKRVIAETWAKRPLLYKFIHS